MAIKKNILVDGIEVLFKARAAVPRLYRLKFGRDIYKDFAALQKSVSEGDAENFELSIESLEVFENIAIMAKQLIPIPFLLLRMSGWSSLIRSPFMKFCHS